jgi:hypothetical protein
VDGIFDQLTRLLNDPAIDKTRQFCNMRIAHAADAASRGRVRHILTGISFHELDAAHRAIITAAQFAS